MLALLCYEKPEDSPVGYLMKKEYREEIANMLNSAILGTFHSMFIYDFKSFSKVTSQSSSGENVVPSSCFKRSAACRKWTGMLQYLPKVN